MSAPPTGLRVLVCGGRAFSDPAAVFEELDRLKPALVITGGAGGADFAALEWARHRGVPVAVFEPHWKALGKAAGPLRNGWMLKYGQPDMVLAFPGGAGTADMLRQARAARVEWIREVTPEVTP